MIRPIFFLFAVRNLRLHWLRSILAMLGIIIGVVAITSMGILGSSLVLSISEDLTTVGDTIVVLPHTGGAQMGRGGGGIATDDTITSRQLERITRASAPHMVIPLYSGGERIRVGGDTGFAAIYGIPTADIPILLERREGQYLRGASGAMVGPRLALEYSLKVGSRFLIQDTGQSLRVVGILEERGMGFDINTDNAIIVSDSWYRSTYAPTGYDRVIVKVRSLDEIEPVMKSIEAALNRRETEVDVYDTRAILTTILDTFGRISTFTIAIGGISLIVAGVSIFNVMMMSVMERYREIGVLRSIGCLRREVRRMFFYESLLLGIAGSVIGGVLSVAGGYIALLVMLDNTSYLLAPTSLIYIPIGMAFGVGTSVLSGLYPAWKASEANPIEALRHE
ncbi:MAG: ABC transporter permease [Methanocalculus sp.]|uniref:ABC transporter permease n=1 Tax=Methanocalculus sp. TaxID=2004547 RepID=UPI002726728E|nr:ABC transporter permease [Methanocalculus sp.]MDO9540685.1 ABC transporter permease [Methanocalculus sp.]